MNANAGNRADDTGSPHTIRVVGASVQHTRFPVDCRLTANTERAMCLHCDWERPDNPHDNATNHAATFGHRTIVTHVEMFLYERAPIEEVKP